MPGLRATQARLLARPTARVVRWTPFLAAVPLGTIASVTARTAETPPPMAGLPAVALLLAACLGFVLDDPAAVTTASVPTPLVLSRALRIVAALTVALALWGAALAYAGLGWVGVSMTAGFLARCAVALAIAAVATEASGSSRAGLAAIVGLVAVFVVVPQGFEVSLRLEPTSGTWGNLYGRWLVVGALGLAVTVVASSDLVARRAWTTPGWVARGRPARATVEAG